MTDFIPSPRLNTILDEAVAAGYTYDEIQTLSGAWLFEDEKRGSKKHQHLRCHRNSDYIKLKQWWAWRFHPEEARAYEIDKPPVRFDPKSIRPQDTLPPKGQRGKPTFR